MKNNAKAVEVRTAVHNRRSFLKLSGLAIAGTGLLLAGCSDDDGDNNNTVPGPGMVNGVFDFGGGDLGILTYAYALEQLEADFYTRVVNNNSFGSTWNAGEQSILADLYSHEVVHREVLQQLITAGVNNNNDMVLPGLSFNYGNLNFADRSAVLQMAMTLEDTGVAAYTGAGRYIENANNLALAGKIVSVESRHASVIRSMINPNNAFFSAPEVVDAGTGKNKVMLPSQVVAMLDQQNLITTPFTANNLP